MASARSSTSRPRWRFRCLDTQYTDAVDVVCMVPLEKEGSLVAQITEKTGGKASYDPGEKSVIMALRMANWFCFKF